MGTFDNAASAKTGASIRNNHADEIGGAAGASPSVTSPVYSHADQISGFNPGLTSFSPAAPISYAEDIKKLDPSKSPFLNPSQAIQTDPLDAFGGIGKPVPPSGRTTPQLTEQLPPPPPLPPRPTALDAFGGTGAPIQPVGGGNAPENAELLARQNADKLKQAKAQQRHQNDLADERAKQARAEATATARMTRMQTEQAERQAKAQTKSQAQQQAQQANRVRMLMEPQGHPGLSDDAQITRAALSAQPGAGRGPEQRPVEPAGHPGLSDAAISSQQRMVTALGKIRGVGDLPTITIDAASNYGDKGVYEVADLIHRTTKADTAQGRELLDKTTDGLSPERADRLRATVASLQHAEAEDSHAIRKAEAKATRDDINLDHTDNDIWSVPEKPMAEGGAAHLPHPLSVEDRIQSAQHVIDTMYMETKTAGSDLLTHQRIDALTEQLDAAMPHAGKLRDQVKRAAHLAIHGQYDEASKLYSDVRNTLGSDEYKKQYSDALRQYDMKSEAGLDQQFKDRAKIERSVLKSMDSAKLYRGALDENARLRAQLQDPTWLKNNGVNPRQAADYLKMVENNDAVYKDKHTAAIQDLSGHLADMVMSPGTAQPDIDTDLAARQQKITDAGEGYGASDLALDAIGFVPAIGTSFKIGQTAIRTARWVARAGIAVDIARDAGKAVEGQLLDTLNKAKVDLRDRAAVTAYMDKHPVEIRRVIESTVFSQVTKQVGSKVGSKGLKVFAPNAGPIAEEAASNLMSKAFEKERLKAGK